MEKVVVTGANGLIGSYLTAVLSHQGKEVYAIVRSKDEPVGNIQSLENVRILYCDLIKKPFCADWIPGRKCSVWYHLAWAGSSGKAREDYSLQLRNVKMACEAVEVAAQLGCSKFVAVGSVTELAFLQYMEQEEFCPEMTAMYPVAKTAACHMMRCICEKYGIPFSWVYLANLYGVGDRTQNIISMILNAYRQGRTPELTEGNQTVDFIYVQDAAEGLAAVGELGRPWESYYLGGSNRKPLKEFVEIIRDMEAPDRECGLGRKEFHSAEIDFEKIDTEKLFRHTGYRPQVSFQKGIGWMAEWLEQTDGGCYK